MLFSFLPRKVSKSCSLTKLEGHANFVRIGELNEQLYHVNAVGFDEQVAVGLGRGRHIIAHLFQRANDGRVGLVVLELEVKKFHGIFASDAL